MKINERSLAMWASSSSPIDKEGFLLKKGELNKGFQKRWFVLKGNLLFYFEKKTDRDPVGVVILEEHSVSLSQLRDPKFCFEVGFRGANSRTYTLSAESEESMTSWMRALTHASFQYLRMMVVELQRQVAELTEQKKDTVPLGMDRVAQPVALPTSKRLATAVGPRSKGTVARPTSSGQGGQPLVQPVRTVGLPHERRLLSCGSSSVTALGHAGTLDDSDGDVSAIATTPPASTADGRASGHVAYSSPSLGRHHLSPSDDPTPTLQPEVAPASSCSSSSSLSAAMGVSSAASLEEKKADDPFAVDVGEATACAAAADHPATVESAEEQLKRLSMRSMHYGPSLSRDSPLTERSSNFSAQSTAE